MLVRLTREGGPGEPNFWPHGTAQDEMPRLPAIQAGPVAQPLFADFRGEAQLHRLVLPRWASRQDAGLHERRHRGGSPGDDVRR